MILELLLSLLVITIVTVFWMYLRHKLPKSRDAAFFTNILLGHRGCKKQDWDITENSIGALKHATKHSSVHGVEFDIMLTKDEIPVVFHDTDRMSRVCEEIDDPHVLNMLPKNKSEHKISLMNLDQVKQFRYKNGDKSETIPTLMEWLDEAQRINQNMNMMIEVKEFSKVDKMAKQLSFLFDKYNLYATSVVGSFLPHSLYSIRKHNPDVVTLLLVCRHMIRHWVMNKGEDRDTPQWKWLEYLKQYPTLVNTLDWLYFHSCLTWLPAFLGVGCIGVDISMVKDGSVNIEALQARGYAVNIWVCNDEEDLQELKKNGKVAITTDYLF